MGGLFSAPAPPTPAPPPAAPEPEPVQVTQDAQRAAAAARARRRGRPLISGSPLGVTSNQAAAAQQTTLGTPTGT